MPADAIILLVAVPLVAGVITLLYTGRRAVQLPIGYASIVLNVGLSIWGLSTVLGGWDEPGIVLVSQMGSWPAPFGISLVMDPMAAIMLTISSIVVAACFVYSVGQMPVTLRSGFFHPLFHLLVFGVHASFLTGDMFNLFVAFEVMLMASYVLLCLGTTTLQMRHAFKYVLLNLLASMMFVTCCGLIYGQTGTLNMADLTRLAWTGQLPAASVPVFVLLLLVFGVKTAIFPVWFWLPDTYYTMHAAIGALFAGLLTKVGAYVMLRIFVMILGLPTGPVAELIAPIILVSAGVTMFLGVLGAVSMHTVRRILSIHIISQVGYMILGVGLAIAAGVAFEVRELAVAGAIFFVIHNMVVKSSLFLCGGLMQQHAGSDDLEQIGGLQKRAPWLATLFIIAALSLAGLPPLSGFFGKLLLIKASFQAHHYALATLAVATSVLTLMSMLKIWSYGFWSPARGRHVEQPDYRPRVAPGMVGVVVLVVVALTMGLGANSFYQMTRKAGAMVVDPRPYIAAVLGPQHAQFPLPQEPVVIGIANDQMSLNDGGDKTTSSNVHLGSPRLLGVSVANPPEANR